MSDSLKAYVYPSAVLSHELTRSRDEYAVVLDNGVRAVVEVIPELFDKVEVASVCVEELYEQSAPCKRSVGVRSSVRNDYGVSIFHGITRYVLKSYIVDVVGIHIHAP